MKDMKKSLLKTTSLAVVLLLALAASARAQTSTPSEHDAEILGVRIGMDVPAALEAVFVNAKRKPGEEKPDAKRSEGKDVRVIYKKLPQGELQILFAEGKWVKEVALTYAAKPYFADLHLAPTGSIAVVGIKDKIDSVVEYGGRYDDRYSIGYTSDRKLERLWWRDEATHAGYRVRVGFVSERLVDGQLAAKTIARKLLGVTPGDEEKFKRAVSQ
jgi:hypothetical protein